MAAHQRIAAGLAGCHLSQALSLLARRANSGSIRLTPRPAPLTSLNGLATPGRCPSRCNTVLSTAAGGRRLLRTDRPARWATRLVGSGKPKTAHRFPGRTNFLSSDCAAACLQCATACLKEADPKPMSRCIALDLECADICRLAAASIARGGAHMQAICAPCADACCSCATECGTHNMDHCQRCVEACKRCADACLAMAH